MQRSFLAIQHLIFQLMAEQIRWNNLTVSNPTTGSFLINGLTGMARSGDFLTVMGPSGSGKSTFLQFLTARLNVPKGYKATGTSCINDLSYDLRKFSKFGVFVRQDDVLLACLTVEETIQFQADLRIEDKEERQDKVKKMIQMLGLEGCKNLKIGGQFVKSISGGQRKRVAIAIQLISDPNCIMLDEPTSGLDSYNALVITKILKDLARQNKIVIATIHQPSSRMFHEFDNLMVLKSGEMVYFGKAKEVVPYMQSLKIEVNLKMNPSDFLMFEISDLKVKSTGQYSLMNSTNYKAKHMNDEVIPAHRSVLIQKQLSMQHYRPPWTQQFKYLFRRAVRNWFRNPLVQMGKIFDVVILSILLIALFHDLDSQKPPQPNFPVINEQFIQRYMGCIFISLFCAIGPPIYQTIMIFPAEREVFFREASCKLYSTYVYFVTRFLVELPGTVLPPVIVCAIVYKIIGLTETTEAFMYFVTGHVLTAISGTNIGLIIGLMFTEARVAISMLPIVLIPVVLFGGLIVKLSTLDGYISWVQYLSPVKYAFSSTMMTQFKDDEFKFIAPIEVSWKDLAGLQGIPSTELILAGVLMVFYGIAALVVLRIKQKTI